MHIDVQCRGFDPGPDFSLLADTRVRMSLGRHGYRISRVVIGLDDINGPRGGEDKRCMVQVFLVQSGGTVVVEDRGQDVRSLLDRCLARASRSVLRRLSRLSRPRYLSRRIVYIARLDPQA